MTKYLLITIACLALNACKAQKNTNTSKMIIENIKANKPVYLENTTITEDLDFTNIVEENYEASAEMRSYINSSVVFKNCKFEGKVATHVLKDGINHTTTFQKNLVFENCIFEKELSFRNIMVQSNFIFTENMCKAAVNMEQATFYADAVFSKSYFTEELKAQNCVFTKNVNFFEVGFAKNASLQSSIFNADAQWGNAKFMAYTDLSLCNFNAGAHFNYVTSTGRWIMNNAGFKAGMELSSCTINNLECKNTLFFGKTKFVNNKITETMNFEKARFYFDKPEFMDTDISKIILGNKEKAMVKNLPQFPIIK